MVRSLENVDVVQAEHEHDEKKGTGDVAPTSAFAGLTRAQCVRKFWRLYITGLGVSLAGMYAGYANSVIGSVIANEGFIEYFATVKDPQTGKPALNSQHISLWAACYFVTSILIQSIAPVTADKFGRKFNMWGVTLFLTLSIVIQVIAPNWWTLLIASLVAGCAGGMMGTSVMVYMSEVALPQFRGALLGSFSLAFALGQVFLAIALKVLKETNPMAFRHIFYSEFVFTGLWLFPMLYLPETPSNMEDVPWYAPKGRHDEGKKALKRLVGNVEGYDVDREYSVIQYEMDESSATAKSSNENSDWKALFTNKINMKRAVISTLPFTFQNVVGVPLMFGYTTYFFQLAGVSDPFLGNMVNQMVLVVGIIISFYTVDKVGRRTLVIGGGAAMATILTIQYATGILFNYTVPLMLSNQNAGWGQKIGLFFGGIILVYLIPCILMFPETKGRTYHELDELFERRVPAWKFASTRTSHQEELQATHGGQKV
ncbi:general substrate transporter [Fusarium phyllophilum]|uniref:General substrate transporter n=1 Tax=Fusarium phyllophilum TaxID=47803 RepID=A0A8H5JTL2_9HYPO|nr:general substrate transporter [Fusarium phyllophilum]